MQTKSQREFTVVELPVMPIVGESLLLPLRCIPELVKFGKLPFVLVLAVDVLCYGLERQDVRVSGLLLAIAHFVLFTPFSVAWTKLAIRGRASVAKHPEFAYSRTQLLYLLASTLMMIAMLVCATPPYMLIRYGRSNFDNQIMLLGGALAFLTLGPYLIGFVRLAFVFPAIAIGRYAGISAAWRQTMGNLERLAAIIVLTYLPYWLIREIFEWYMGYHPPGVAAAFRGTIDMLLVALATTAVAGPALAYKALVLDRPDEEEVAAAATSGGREVS